MKTGNYNPAVKGNGKTPMKNGSLNAAMSDKDKDTKTNVDVGGKGYLKASAQMDFDGQSKVDYKSNNQIIRIIK